jgi:Secretion system C-terminal sorting domain/DOMON domain
MKKSYLLFAILALINLTNAQIKSTGVVSLRTGADLTTIKIDLNQATSTATLTMVGPSSRWFSVGFNTTSMTSNTDVFTSAGTQVIDQVLPGGQIAPNTDTTNNLTVVSNTVSGTSRTVVVTRPFNTGDSKDYTFNYASNSLNIIWAFGPDTNIANEHDRFGSKALTFTTLGTEDFNSINDIVVSPNPSSGIFTISKNSSIQISKIKIFDTNAKLLKEINVERFDSNNTINLSELSKGMYFLEISSKEDKIVKKVMIE